MTKTTAGYVPPAYLQELARLVRPLKERSHELMSIRPGSRLLDVGCGPATDTRALAALAGRDGRVVGVDQDLHMLRAAGNRAGPADARAAAPAHLCATALRLPFQNGSFDAVRCERLLQHVSDAGSAVREMSRVTRPGGRIVLIDTDHTTFSISCDCPDVEWILRNWQCSRLANGYVARRLAYHLGQAGVQVLDTQVTPLHTGSLDICRTMIEADLVESEALARGVVTGAQLERYRESCRRFADNGVFFASINVITCYGVAS